MDLFERQSQLQSLFQTSPVDAAYLAGSSTGRKIAGTGAIDASGKVYPIGGVQEKVVAAQRSGAVLFFVPHDNAADARSVAHGMTIVEVTSFQDALTYLEQHR